MTQDESTVIRIAPIGWVRAPRAEAPRRLLGRSDVDDLSL